MKCPHCGSDCAADPCAGQIAATSLELRRIGRDLSRCDHKSAETCARGGPPSWCRLCGAHRMQSGRWIAPACADRAKALDRLIKTWGYDLGDEVKPDADDLQ